MPQLELTSARRRALRAQAHHLPALAHIGSNGLSEAAVAEIDALLAAHALLKVRVLEAEREERAAMGEQLADTLGAAFVQHIGRLLVLWRPLPEKKDSPAADDDGKPRHAAPRDVKVLRYSSRGGQRPEVRFVRVLGNQRLSAGGKLKKARPKQRSLKKGRSSQG